MTIGRWLGSFSSKSLIKSASPAPNSSGTGFGSDVQIIKAMAGKLPAWNGTLKQVSSYKTTPKDHTSAFMPYGLFLQISGDKYDGVPTVEFAWPIVFSMILEMPKSPSFTTHVLSSPSPTMKMFAGFRSRCRILREWMNCRAAHICTKTNITVCSRKRTFSFRWSWMRRLKSPPVAYSMTIYIMSQSRMTSKQATMFWWESVRSNWLSAKASFRRFSSVRTTQISLATYCCRGFCFGRTTNATPEAPRPRIFSREYIASNFEVPSCMTLAARPWEELAMRPVEGDLVLRLVA
mmetsp:Transcript_116760/g.325351  ORF Transcript_116760/g.325351 Transcript_116760/m.325351 type:complete len:292 (-) Transcript_116760:15-890(-)